MTRAAALTMQVISLRTSHLFIITLLAALALILIQHRRPAGQREFMLARMNGSVSIHAAGRGNPYISLSDGRDLLTSYSGDEQLSTMMERNSARPLSLASADFDEDGVPDLISGYGVPGGGMITLLRGNVDSIYPNAPEARQRKADGKYTDAPFLSPAYVFSVPEAVDFVGCGDFDADSHWDVVAGARGDDKLYMLAGDGKGSLSRSKEVRLPGAITALATGEINRADGLADIVVGVLGSEGPRALVLEGAEGAFNARAETFALRAEAKALALAHLDDDYLSDLAVAANSELVVVHGRDRKLSLDEIRRAEVGEATVDTTTLPFAVTSMTAGRFDGDERISLALLADDGSVHLLGGEGAKGTGLSERQDESLAREVWAGATGLVAARVSSFSADSFVVIDPTDRLLRIVGKSNSSGPVFASLDVEGAPAALLPMRLNSDALNDLVLLRSGHSAPTVIQTSPQSSFVVTNTAGEGPGSLLQAIQDANASGGADQISFNIPGTGVQTISPTFPLLGISEAVIIDATTQPGFAGKPLVELSGAGAGPNTNGLFIFGGNTVVRGLAINRFPVRGIDIRNLGGNIIEGNFIGTDASGTAGLGNADDAVVIIGSSNNTIGGTTAAARNVLSGNGSDGVDMFSGATGNVVQGNFIGTDITGTLALGNDRGVNLNASAPANTVGGTAAGARNIISGNRQAGMFIFGPVEGGLPPDSAGSLVQGNYIGTDVTGANALANIGNGIVVDSAPNNTIGGTTPAARNIISGNNNARAAGSGIGVQRTSGNLVQGNYIGTDVTGGKALPNSISGVNLGGPRNVVGGAVAGARNIISGNNSQGIGIGGFFPDAPGTIVQGNFIGTDVTGTRDLGNGSHGISIATSSNTIGGLTPETRNIISANKSTAVVVQGNTATANQVLGNRIGTDITGTKALGNAGNGVDIRQNASNNQIGGTQPGAGNTIAFNSDTGVFIGTGVGNSVLSNSIFGNDDSFGKERLGIDIGFDFRVTPNDPGDADTGANNLQNFPVLNSVTSAGGTTTIQGSLNSTPGTVFRIEFFSNSYDTACREGETFLGSTSVTTNSNGNANFSFQTAASLGPRITATATDPAGNTSEFSDCLAFAQAVRARSDVRLSAEAAPSPVATGTRLTYTITARNTGPDAADGVIARFTMPAGTTFAPLATGQFSCTTPAAGRVGPIICTLDPLPADGSATFVVVLNVLAAPGSTLPAAATVTSRSNDSRQGNNSVAISTDVRGGSIVNLAWQQPQPSPADPIPAPSNLQVTSGGAAAASVVAPAQSDCRLTNVNIYKSDSPNVQLTRDNLWRVVAPEQLQATMSAAPVGSFYKLTNVWQCGDVTVESGGSNEAGSGGGGAGGPRVDSLKVTSKIKASGSGFTASVQVFINDVGFSKRAKVSGGTSLTQKGTLSDGRSITEAAPARTTVTIKFVNSDGSSTSVPYTRQ